MAIWDRVKPDVEDRIAVHLLVGGLRGYLVNTADASRGWTREQVRQALDSQLDTPLSAADITELDAIANRVDAQPNISAKLLACGLIESIFIAAEMGLITQAKFESDLGIS